MLFRTVLLICFLLILCVFSAVPAIVWLSRMGPPSLLTRRVFRALLSSRPYVFTDCARHPRVHASFPRPRLCKHNGYQRRSIFGLSLGTDRKSLAEASNTGQNMQNAMERSPGFLVCKRFWMRGDFSSVHTKNHRGSSTGTRYTSPLKCLSTFATTTPLQRVQAC